LTDLTTEDWKRVLKQIAPNGKPDIIDGFAAVMPDIVAQFKLDTRNRQAHFIAQTAHESDYLRTTVEYASGAAYEERKDLGNTHKGDGVRFKGRGLIQLTGRYNYRKAAEHFKQPFIEKPELAAQFPWAALVAGWFWHTNQLNRHADKDDIRAVTKAINGGYTHLDRRTAVLGKAKAALT
jgi:putative chitinase